MTALRWALLADGTSDRALVPIIRWVLLEASPSIRITEQPDFRRRETSARLEDEIRQLVQAVKPRLLFVHRDAERETLERRRAEIPDVGEATVKVVPVRMTEAWLLVDERAIRAAAGNPNGTVSLDLPPTARLEDVPDPKAVLRECILEASELSQRRKARLQKDLGHRVQLVAENIGDFATLRRLPAFRAFEEDTRAALEAL